MKKNKPTREQALEVARYLGCSGAHQREDGVWLPCNSEEEMQKISNRAETQTRSPLYKAQPNRKRRKKKGWEELREGGVIGIETLGSGGLVSAKDALGASRQVRPTDPDTFSNVESARVRSRQLGCIGVRRYNSTTGGEVWMPCSNESDYRRRMGIGPQARRDKEKEKRNFERRIIAKLKKSDDDWAVVRGINLLEIKEKSSRRRARRDRSSATPSLRSERISGSSVNAPNTASSVSSAKDIELSEDTVRGLLVKVRNHNKRMDDLGKDAWSRANVGALKAVWRRGAGAFSVSHRPNMTRQQWAMARVNAFLKMLERGKPENLRYISDIDLLPDNHPWKKKTKASNGFSLGESKGLRTIRGSAEPFNPDAVDGDMDGTVQEGTAFERPAAPKKITSAFRSAPKPKLSAGTKPTRSNLSRDEELGLENMQTMTYDISRSTAQQFSAGRGKGWKSFIAERVKKVQKPIITALMGEVKTRNTNTEKRAFIIGGPIAVGKSTLRTLYGSQIGIPDRSGALHLDPDEMKELIPEYKQWMGGLLPEAGDLTHAESMHLTQMGVKEAIANDMDIVHDTTGRNFRDTLDDLDAGGYKKIAHFATGRLDIAKAQSEERARTNGRWRPDSEIERSFKHMPGVIQGHLGSDTFDEFYLWDTTARPPVLVAKKIKGKPLEVLDKKMWDLTMRGGK